MIKPELYHKTVDILYQAYFNDTLMHTNCCACAVGNIVSANCGYGIPVKSSEEQKATWVGAPYPSNDGWARVFVTNVFGGAIQRALPAQYTGLAKFQIDATGYTWRQLAKIEYAFEMADQGSNDEDWMFNGLVAVLEVLKEIHQVTDEDLIQSNNNRFRDHYQKKLSAVLQ